MDEALKHAEGWSTAGHKWIGEKVRRMFDAEVGGAADGRITAWQAADGEDPALWHVVHEDGDEEVRAPGVLAACLPPAPRRACARLLPPPLTRPPAHPPARSPARAPVAPRCSAGCGRISRRTR